MQNINIITDAENIPGPQGAFPSFGTISIHTGWNKNGSSSDATLDLRMLMVATNAEANATNYLVSSNASWFVALSKDDTEASCEMQKFTFADNGADKLTTMTYGKVNENALTANLATAPIGATFRYLMNADGMTVQPNELAPAGFWNVDSTNTSLKDGAWTQGMTRTDAGTAEIATGSKVTANISFLFNGN